MLIHPDDLPCEVGDTVIFAANHINFDSQKFREWVCGVIHGEVRIIEEDAEIPLDEDLEIRTSQKTEYEESNTIERKEYSSEPYGSGEFVHAQDGGVNDCILIENWTEI